MAMCFSIDFSMVQKGNDFASHVSWLKCYDLINNSFAYMSILAVVLECLYVNWVIVQCIPLPKDHMFFAECFNWIGNQMYDQENWQSGVGPGHCQWGTRTDPLLSNVIWRGWSISWYFQRSVWCKSRLLSNGVYPRYCHRFIIVA